MSARRARPPATTVTAAAVALLTAPTLLIVPGAALLTETAAAAATALFLAALGAVPDWQLLPVTVASDRVQHSGYPWAVARWEPAATALTVRYWPTTPPGPRHAAAPPAPTAPTTPPTTPPTAATAAPASALSTPPTAPPPAPRPAPPSAARPVPPSGAAAPASGELCPGRGGDNTPTAVGVTALPPGYQGPTDAQQGTVVAFALEQLGKPYVWGAAGPDSWDCSGLTMRAWGAAGVALPRTTFQQVLSGGPVSSPAALAPGDLIFTAGLDGTAANPGHVGMYIGAVDGAPSLVHAPRTGKNVEINPVSSWAGQIVAIRRPTPTR